MTPAVIYAAKSSTDKHGSIPEQLDDCRGMCEENDWEVVGEFKDENFSAYSGNRGPGWTSAQARAAQVAEETGSIVMLVAQAHDRFARGAGDAPGAPESLGEIWHRTRRQNVHLRTVEDDEELRDEASVAAIGRRAHIDSVRKSKSVKKGLRRRAEGGRPSGGPPAYAVRWVDGDLVWIDRHVPIVERIFEEYLAGRSQGAITAALNRDGIPAMKGGRWSQVSVRKVLTNPIYVGKIRNAGQVYDGAHDGIIPQEVFDRAQAISAEAMESRNRGGGRLPEGKHLFTRGLLRCGKCGSALAPRSVQRKTGIFETYRCLGRRLDPTSCDQTPVPRELIDGAMLRELDRRYLDLDATRARYAARRAASAQIAGETLAQAERDLLQVEDAIARIRRDYRDGKVTAEEWREFRGELEAERDAAQAAADQARERVQAVAAEDVTDEVLDRLAAIRAAVLRDLDHAPDLDALRKLLRQLFHCVGYVRGTLIFTEHLSTVDLDAMRRREPHPNFYTNRFPLELVVRPGNPRPHASRTLPV